MSINLHKAKYGSTVNKSSSSYDIDFYSNDRKELEISDEITENSIKNNFDISRVFQFVLLIFVIISAALIGYTVAFNRNYLTLEFSQGHTNIGKGNPVPPSANAGAKTNPSKPTPAIAIPALKPVTTVIITDTESQIDESSETKFGLIRSGYSHIKTQSSDFNYAFLSNYEAIIEPYALTHFWCASIDETLYYKYKLTSKTDSTISYEGIMFMTDDKSSVGITVPCNAYDEFNLEFNAYSVLTDELQSSDSISVLCLYVRREIRSLSKADLSSTMNAMYELWSNSDKEGKLKYGEKFYSATYMTNFHHFNAAWQDSDHVHEGNGFLLQHLKLTNMFEKSMQAVDPSVSLPYWDFTIDSEKGHGTFNSFLFTEDVFGSMKLPVDVTKGFTYSDDRILDGAIQNGRWAFLRTDSSHYSELTKAYGYTRAPWNMNPSPYVSRFASDYRTGINLPSCSSHYSILQAGDMMDFFYNIQFEPHATTHALIGGIYGCDKLLPFLESGSIPDETSLKNICSKWVFYLKEFYRYNFIVPKSVDECKIESMNEENESVSCGFTCVVDPESKSFHNNIYAKLSKHLSADQTADSMDEWIDFICNGDGYKIFAGDHLESASPADPSFWVIHPTLERLLHAKLMSGGFMIEKWATTIVKDFVCEKSHCYEPELGYTDTHAECCYGHYENDQLLDADSGDRTLRFGLTNKEMLEATDPRSSTYSMPYIYDSFTWDHCTSLSFSSLFSSMKAQATKS